MTIEKGRNDDAQREHQKLLPLERQMLFLVALPIIAVLLAVGVKHAFTAIDHGTRIPGVVYEEPIDVAEQQKQQQVIDTALLASIVAAIL